MLKTKYCLLSNDVETHSIFYNQLRDKTGHKVYKEALPYLLDLYEEYDIKATFFYTGTIAKLLPESVKIVADKGHEIASHGLTHKVEKSYDSMPLKEQIDHLKESKKILEDLSGQEVVSFRSPALRINEDTPVALAESGFKIDSSVSPQRMDMFMSFGSNKKISRLFSPRKLYYTSPKNLNKRGAGPIIEVPVSSFILPFTGSLMRSGNLIFKLLRWLLTFESGHFNTDIVYYMHPTEFIQENSNNKFKIKNRSSNYIKYLFADIIRRKIKVRNLGDSAKKYYEELIEFYLNRDYKFTTIKNYCQEKGFNI